MLHLYLKNPRYLAQDGKPLVLIGSGEHYGALLNTAFDYKTYFETLGNDHLNQCRIFSGTYRELPREFGIEENLLAPKLADFVCPWATDENGKFDLTRWNDAYFSRLADILRTAQTHGIIVEYVLFCYWYNDALYQHSPLHPDNNLQGVGSRNKEDFWGVDNPLLPYQEAFVRKIVTELNSFSNVYFEIINEPYTATAHSDYMSFQAHIAEIIADTAVNLPETHLIAINVQNRAKRITSLPEQVSIINFHYALPDAVHLNYHLGKALADDETGFAGQKSAPYRQEAWRFLLAGGSIFSHLDYSFTLAHPDGNALIYGKTPGFGGPLLRKQFALLKRFLEAAAIWDMEPLPEIFASNAGDIIAAAMGKPFERYAVYMAHTRMPSEFALVLPPGTYQLRWFDPIGCHELAPGWVEHKGGYLNLAIAVASDEMALLLTRE